MVTRRGFLSGLLAVAAAEAIPFNRVWFLPKNIVVPKTVSATIGQYADYLRYSDLEPLDIFYYDKLALDNLKQNMPFQNMCQIKPLPESKKKHIQFYRYKLENI